MTKDEINKLMGWLPCHTDNSPDSLVMRVRHLVAKAVAAEREACAKLCDELQDEDGYDAWSTECAAAIRARGNT